MKANCNICGLWLGQVEAEIVITCPSCLNLKAHVMHLIKHGKTKGAPFEDWAWYKSITKEERRNHDIILEITDFRYRLDDFLNATVSGQPGVDDNGEYERSSSG